MPYVTKGIKFRLDVYSSLLPVLELQNQIISKQIMQLGINKISCVFFNLHTYLFPSTKGLLGA